MAFILAIDGPAGAGKSTIAKLTADRLGIIRVDTGAIYRSVAWLAREKKLDRDEDIARAAEKIDLVFEPGGRVRVEGHDVTDAIRTAEISQAASKVSAIPAVRAALLELQRRLGRANAKGAVLEGRDIGTVVFPDAEVKIFLTASPEARAKRRVKDLEKAGQPADYDHVLAEIRERDERDSTRATAPLKAASDAVHVDTTKMTIDEVVEEIVRTVSGRTA